MTENQELKPQRPRRQRRRGIDWAAVIGLFLGLLFTAAMIFGAWTLLQRLLVPQPITVPEEAAPIVLTAEPTIPPTATTPPETPTSIPTFTPIPTRDVSSVPDELTVGFFARVSNTDGAGVRVRGGPSTSNVGLTVEDEGELVEVIGGPEDGSGLVWWQVRLADEDTTEGWVAAQFLEPAAAP